MLFSYLKDEFYKCHSEVCVLHKDAMCYGKDDNEFPIIYEKEMYRGIRKMAKLSDYEASVRLHLIPEDVSNKHRRYMYRRFGEKYLKDLEAHLKAPIQLKLNKIDMMLEEISTEESSSV